MPPRILPLCLNHITRSMLCDLPLDLLRVCVLTKELIGLSGLESCRQTCRHLRSASSATRYKVAEAWRDAARNGHLTLLQRAYGLLVVSLESRLAGKWEDFSPPAKSWFALFPHLMAGAISCDNIPMLDWLDTTLPMLKSNWWEQELWNISPELPWYSPPCSRPAPEQLCLVQLAIYKDRLACVQWILKRRPMDQCSPNLSCFRQMLIQAIDFSAHSIYEWILPQVAWTTTSGGIPNWQQAAVHEACRGKFGYLQWLHSVGHMCSQDNYAIIATAMAAYEQFQLLPDILHRIEETQCVQLLSSLEESGAVDRILNNHEDSYMSVRRWLTFFNLLDNDVNKSRIRAWISEYRSIMRRRRRKFDVVNESS